MDIDVFSRIFDDNYPSRGTFRPSVPRETGRPKRSSTRDRVLYGRPVVTHYKGTDWSESYDKITKELVELREGGYSLTLDKKGNLFEETKNYTTGGVYGVVRDKNNNLKSLYEFNPSSNNPVSEVIKRVNNEYLITRLMTRLRQDKLGRVYKEIVPYVSAEDLVKNIKRAR